MNFSELLVHKMTCILNFHPIGEQEIKALKVICSNTENGCGWVGELRSLDDHLTTCAYALLCCPNKCMEDNEEVHVLRHDLDHHLKDKCPNRQYQCPHCKDTGRHCNITTTHLETCPKVKIPCPNTDCKALVPRCKLANHRSKCQYEAVSCKYAKIGCQKKPLRKHLEQHEGYDIFHLHLAIETVNKLQQEINQQREEIKAVKEEQKMMNDGIMACQAGPCVFKMRKYYQHKSSKAIWHSPPFYSHPGGYKMCLRVDPNGNGDGTGTHVLVYAYLMKGRNDDTLPWPFTVDVTVTLLNQLTDGNHHMCIFSFSQDTKASRRVVEGEIAPTGYGRHKFISHNQLGYAPWNCQYLKDDCLYFQIKVRAQAAKPTKPWLQCTV